MKTGLRSDLPGVLWIRLTHGHVGIFRRIWRLLDRKRLGLRRHPEAVRINGIHSWLHAIQMP